jgi:hypothetical protein
VKVPSVTVTAFPAVRLARDEVTLGVREAGVVAPEMVIATGQGGALVDGNDNDGAIGFLRRQA